MVFVNSGLGGQIVAAPESTYGVAVSLASATPYEFNSETLELKKNVLQGKGIRASALHNRASRRVVTYYSGGGGINLDLPTRGLNPWLYQMFGSKGQTLAALTEISTDGAYKAVHAPGSLLGSSLTIQKGVASVDGTAANPFTHTGVKFTDWTLSCAMGAIAELAVTIDSRNELAGSGTSGQGVNGDTLNVYPVPALATFTEPANSNIFHFREASLITGAAVTTTGGVSSITSPATLGNVKGAQVKYGFHMDTERYFLGSAGFKAEPIENDYRDISGQFEIEWLNAETQYLAFTADAPIALELSFVGNVIGSAADHETLQILIPNVHLEGETPKVGGPAVITQTVPFTGLDDGTNNPIQATYITLDAS